MGFKWSNILEDFLLITIIVHMQVENIGVESMIQSQCDTGICPRGLFVIWA